LRRPEAPAYGFHEVHLGESGILPLVANADTLGFGRQGDLRGASLQQLTPIQLFVPTFSVDECLAEIRQCLERGWTGLGYKTVELEDAWRAYAGLPHAHFLNSATSGLHLAVNIFREADGWSDGDEVITSPVTFVSTNHVILYERLTPVFADIDEYLCLDSDKVERKVTATRSPTPPSIRFRHPNAAG
jgi:hypothetical protein